MGQIDRDALNHFETEARLGAAEALFQLGLAYSTGHGAPIDLVVAHKWFNLAALKGTEEALAYRSEIAREMTSTQIFDAQRQAREWLRA
jgi:TPR repeat protein